MGKKYLIYIHAPEFEKEPQKSALINVLLTQYYQSKVPVASDSLQLLNKTMEKVRLEELKKPIDEFKPAPPDPVKGYPCCNRMSPCKHWVWQSEGSNWLNTLTGLTREVS